MNEQTRRAHKAFMSVKRNACKLISYYLDHHKEIYVSDEKNFYYDYAIKEAYREVYRGNDAPIKILDRLLAKYDTWAHTGLENDSTFSVMVSAVDDLIDLIQTS